MVCPSKDLRNKRRLLSFLLRKWEQNENINIDIFKFSKAIYHKTFSQINSNNALKFPEARFVPLITTFQNSSNSWQDDQFFLQKDVLKPKFKKLNIFQCATEIISSDKTNDKGFTHIFRVYIILKHLNFSKNPIPAKDFISTKLCGFNKPILFDDNSKLYFKIDHG